MVLLTALGAGLASLSDAAAHDIPSQVQIRAFVKPQGQRLNLLVRVPLEAMRDLSWPTDEEGFLDLARAQPVLPQAATLWISGNIGLYEDGAAISPPEILAARISLPSDRSFADYPSALASFTGSGLDDSTQIYWQQALLDVRLAYPIRSERSEFSIHPAFERLGMSVTTVLFFLHPDGAERAFQLHGDPGVIRLDPRWHQAAFHFIQLGFQHILDGTDHLLFLLCLVVACLQVRSLLLVVTSFTAAHSITLLAAAWGAAPQGLWFPPLIETLIAASIVYMAIENIIGGDQSDRWMVAFAFGLVHGFGFSFFLRDSLQFAGGHLLTSLLCFNIGVEAGQLLVIAALVPALHLLFRSAVKPRLGTIILSILVGHTAWHWMIERGSTLSQYSWPAMNAANLASLLRWLMAAVILAGLLWLVSGWLNRFKLPRPSSLASTSSKGTEP